MLKFFVLLLFCVMSLGASTSVISDNFYTYAGNTVPQHQLFLGGTQISGYVACPVCHSIIQAQKLNVDQNPNTQQLRGGVTLTWVPLSTKYDSDVIETLFTTAYHNNEPGGGAGVPIVLDAPIK